MLPNDQIAQRLEELARVLNEQGASVYRVAAWRRAALSLRRLAKPVSEIYQEEGLEGLRKLPGVGDRIALAIQTLILTGRLPMLDRLRGQMEPVDVLMTVPGIGRVQAARLHQDLGIDSLEDLEAAAHDGRLGAIAGFGQKRISGIIDSLASRLGRVRAVPTAAASEVSVAELLDVDREYREKGAAGSLRRIAPRRFNPKREAWLPVLHTQRGTRHFTALFSNTARAHEAGKTRDWVVIYWDGPSGEHQHTIVTARQGPLSGRRIVRGREPECADYYASLPRQAA
ncbi:MAG TPA: helix-hairpin-helix domain-containing protein [Bryobacteraceae bacterium]|nr:helix-hairpin-helix domain-containing protein [Bryobacteraceae bacterium]